MTIKNGYIYYLLGFATAIICVAVAKPREKFPQEEYHTITISKNRQAMPIDHVIGTIQATWPEIRCFEQVTEEENPGGAFAD